MFTANHVREFFFSFFFLCSPRIEYVFSFFIYIYHFLIEFKIRLFIYRRAFATEVLTELKKKERILFNDDKIVEIRI